MGDFAMKLKTIRLSHGYTQESLAAEIGLSKSAISMYENGNREPDFETLELLADVFNVPLSALIGDESHADDETELWEIRETLRRRPEMRTLFSLGKNASADDVKKAIAIITALRKANDDDE